MLVPNDKLPPSRHSDEEVKDLSSLMTASLATALEMAGPSFVVGMVAKLIEDDVLKGVSMCGPSYHVAVKEEAKKLEAIAYTLQEIQLYHVRQLYELGDDEEVFIEKPDVPGVYND